MKLWLVLVYVTATTYVLHSIHDTEESARQNACGVGEDVVDREGWIEVTYRGQRAAVRVEPRWVCVTDAEAFLAGAKLVAEQHADHAS